MAEYAADVVFVKILEKQYIKVYYYK